MSRLSRRLRLPVLLAVPILAGCVEGETVIALRADGSGTLAANSRFSEKFANAIHRLRALGPEFSEEFDGSLLKAPDEALSRELKGLGLEVLKAKVESGEKKLETSVELAFRSLEAVRHTSRIQGMTFGDRPLDLRLTRDGDGVYTMALHGNPDAVKGTGLGEDEEEEPEEAPSEEEERKAGEALEIMLGLMEEMTDFRVDMTLEVPGTIVDHAPAIQSKKEGSRVTWTLDFEGMIAIPMELVKAGIASGKTKEEALGGPMFRVRFRMPEGKDLPAAALWDGRAPGPEKKKAAPPGGGR